MAAPKPDSGGKVGRKDFGVGDSQRSSRGAAEHEETSSGLALVQGHAEMEGAGYCSKWEGSKVEGNPGGDRVDKRGSQGKLLPMVTSCYSMGRAERKTQDATQYKSKSG